MTRIVIVGASLAGTQAAQTIRRAGFEGDLVMVGDEPHYPYDRPPLSKNYLTDDEPDEAKLRLRAAADPDALGVEWRLGYRAVSMDTATRSITLDDGGEIAYDGAVIATGARPRRLPGTDPARAGLAELRTLDDARSLRTALDDGPSRVAVCGAGFIGAEVAASARERGIDVTLIDAAAAPLDRVLDHAAGMAVADLHRSHGVDVRLGTGVDRLLGDDEGPVTGVALSDGTTVDAALVVVGIGVLPNTEWLEGSGVTVDNGIVADETCLAAPGVVVAGDVARWPNRRFGGQLMRVEQWDNAVDMGMYVGKRLLAELNDPAAPSLDELGVYEPVPWFWSDQYDRKIQLAGVTSPHHEVVQGSIEEGRFVQIYGDGDGKLTGALCWNRPRQAIVSRQLVAAGEDMDAARERLA